MNDGQYEQDEFLAQQLAACYSEEPTTTITSTTVDTTTTSTSNRSSWNNTSSGVGERSKPWWRNRMLIFLVLAVIILIPLAFGVLNSKRGDDNTDDLQRRYTTYIVENDGDILTLQRSNNGQLFTLVRASSIENSGGGVQPVARSYDGHEWEHAHTATAPTTDWNCTTAHTSCSNTLPAGTYFLQERWHVATISSSARFLERATFGVTRSLRRDFLQTTRSNESDTTTTTVDSFLYTAWLTKQMNASVTPPTSHRAYFRQRINTEAATTTQQQQQRKVFGITTNPCDNNAWFRRILFSVRDRGATVSIQPQQVANSTTVWWQIIVRGQVRSVVNKEQQMGWGPETPDDLNGPRQLVAEGEYIYCSNNDQTRRGEYRLSSRVGDNRCRLLDSSTLNVSFPTDATFDFGVVPVMDQTSAAALQLPALHNASFWHQYLPFGRNNPLLAEYRMRVPPTNCRVGVSRDALVVARTEANEWLVWTPRLVLHDNTLALGGAVADEQMLCPNVPRTLFNERYCRLSQPDQYPCRAGDGDTTPGQRVVICGSPGEVANTASLGDHWLDVAPIVDDTVQPEHLSRQREFVWSDLILKGAPDQLRQRVAWILFQIFSLDKTSIRDEAVQTESFLTFYDIFVRNAFGNYLDVLREVSYNPLMAENLSFLNSQSLSHAYSLNKGEILYPDENMAREIMQLHTIGLIRLNLDGTAHSTPSPTYDNEDIMSAARAWTGFVAQSPRGNVETPSAVNMANTIDPLRIDPVRRDPLPKTDLEGGFLGDGYPLCADLPPQAFLHTGAKYRLLGSLADTGAVRHLRLATDSDLYARLCAAKDTAEGGSCTYPSVVQLDQNLSHCQETSDEWEECMVETVRVLQVNSILYEYIPFPCVQLAFYNEGKKAIDSFGGFGVCANPLLAVAGAACCGATPTCDFAGERLTLDGARKRCESIQLNLCEQMQLFAPTESCPGDRGLHWIDEPCRVLVKVRDDGYAAIVHDLLDGDVIENLSPSWPAYFRVYWNDGIYPSVADNTCDSHVVCESFGDTCICDGSVAELPVFLNAPASKQALSRLHVGHAGLAFGLDDRALVRRSQGDYHYYSAGGTCCDANTVFEIVDRTGQVRFLRNVESRVSIGSFASFRNPPHFNSFFIPFEATVTVAQYETEALLRHLFSHPNTAPFVARRFIQRFGISNPSPRYVGKAAEAFRDGIYRATNGVVFGTGSYGDLQALVAAVLHDRESLSLALAGDPFHGALKEPLLKVLGFMRAMEYEATTPLVELFNMDAKIGQAPYEQNSVFNFWGPDFAPPGPFASTMLVAPESQVMSNTRVIGLLNGLLGLVLYGLAECRDGFGTFGTLEPCTSFLPSRQSSGHLTYEPRSYDSTSVVRDLSVLLTSGRLTEERVAAIERSYNQERVDPVVGLLLAMQLIIVSPEFHSTSFSETEGDPVVPPDENDSSSGRPDYKAVIHLALTGGCDSFNVLVPSDSCGQLYQEYLDARETVALRQDQVLSIEGNFSDQPCNEFGIHHKLPFVKTLFDEGDLLFLANTGILTEPVDRGNYSDLTISRLFAHDAMQDEVNTLDPLKDVIGTGALGRLADVLHSNGLITDRIVLEGLPTAVAGQSTSPIVSLDHRGVSSLQLESPDRRLLERFVNRVGTGEDESGTLGSLWSSILGQALGQTQELVDLLGPTSRSGSFRRDSRLGRKFRLIQELIVTHENRGVDRDVFFVTMPGFDTHADVAETLERHFNELNSVLEDFSGNLKSTGFWNNVAIVQTSEFARTLSPNSGEGTDHAWGGNYWIAGGAVRGNRILGQYPSTFGEKSPLAAGRRGRLIPTQSWDAVFNGLAAWMGGNGTSAQQMDYVLPNRLKFHRLFSSQDMFSAN